MRIYFNADDRVATGAPIAIRATLETQSAQQIEVWGYFRRTVRDETINIDWDMLWKGEIGRGETDIELSMTAPDGPVTTRTDMFTLTWWLVLNVKVGGEFVAASTAPVVLVPGRRAPVDVTDLAVTGAPVREVPVAVNKSKEVTIALIVFLVIVVIFGPFAVVLAPVLGLWFYFRFQSTKPVRRRLESSSRAEVFLSAQQMFQGERLVVSTALLDPPTKDIELRHELVVEESSIIKLASGTSEWKSRRLWHKPETSVVAAGSPGDVTVEFELPTNMPETIRSSQAEIRWFVEVSAWDGGQKLWAESHPVIVRKTVVDQQNPVAMQQA